MKRQALINFWFVVLTIQPILAQDQKCLITHEGAQVLYAAGKLDSLITILQGNCTASYKYKYLFLAYTDKDQTQEAERYLDTLARRDPSLQPSWQDPIEFRKAWGKWYSKWSLTFYLGVNLTWGKIVAPIASVREVYKPVIGGIAELKFRWNPSNRRSLVWIETGVSVSNQSVAYQRALENDISFSGYYGRWDIGFPIRVMVFIAEGDGYLALGMTNNFLVLAQAQADFPEKVGRTPVTDSRTTYIPGLEFGAGRIEKYVQIELRYNFSFTNQVLPDSYMTYLSDYGHIQERGFELSHTVTILLSTNLKRKLAKHH